MNANPADCDCERCEIDRERAPYQRAWLTAFREATTAQVSAALDAVESGSHRDSPAANGALLALTGLMLEKGKRALRRCGRRGGGSAGPGRAVAHGSSGDGAAHRAHGAVE